MEISPNKLIIESKQQSFLEPSATFKAHVASVIATIIVFVSVYLLLVALSVVIMVISTLAGIAIICIKPSFITLAAGAGLIGFGVMIVLFMLKFIFSKTVDTDPKRIEIIEAEHPKLFAFINNIAENVGTLKPKKIFLSPDVNAAVFYDSNFLCMFMPVRKNLLIGLGLVNAVDMSEFKAVIAHEFGHFSQRSMKLGSYVYTANRVIYNLLYENSGWESMLNSFGSAHSILYFFAKVTYHLANIIKSILAKVYEWIKLRYMALSREMEYHADLIAVSISGSEQMISSLRRIEFADTAYNLAINQLNSFADKKQKTDNLFEVQKGTIAYLCRVNKVSKDYGLPVITDDEIDKRKKTSRVVINNQWASHPLRHERETNIRRFPVIMPEDHSSPWELFDDYVAVQKKMTMHMYQLGFTDEKEFTFIAPQKILDNIEQESKAAALPAKFDGFYEGRIIYEIDTDALINITSTFTDTFESVYSNQFKEDVYTLVASIDDRNVIEGININNLSIKSFDFDGQKFRQKDAPTVIKKLNDEIEQLHKKVNKYDTKVFGYYFAKAKIAGREKELKEKIDFHLVIQWHAYYFNESLKALNNIYQTLSSKNNWTNAALIAMSQKINEEKEKYEELLNRVNNFYVPQMGDNKAIYNLKPYLLSETIAEIPLSSFDYNQFIKLYGQIATSSAKIGTIWQNSYRSLLILMDELN